MTKAKFLQIAFFRLNTFQDECDAQHFFLISNHFRFLNGMGLGFELAVATVYIVEIASTDMRGILGCFVQFMGSFGVLFTYILGSFLNWYYLALVNGLSVIIFVIGNI